MADISTLRDGQRKIDVEGTISDIAEAREVNLRAGGSARVTEAVLTDQSGSIKLSLWNDQIEQVKDGSRIRVLNGYTNSFRGEVRVNVGQYGKLEVV